MHSSRCSLGGVVLLVVISVHSASTGLHGKFVVMSVMGFGVSQFWEHNLRYVSSAPGAEPKHQYHN